MDPITFTFNENYGQNITLSTPSNVSPLLLLTHNFNFHWRWRWWNRIQAILLNNLFFFTLLIAKPFFSFLGHRIKTRMKWICLLKTNQNPIWSLKRGSGDYLAGLLKSGQYRKICLPEKSINPLYTRAKKSKSDRNIQQVCTSVIQPIHLPSRFIDKSIFCQ